MGKKSDKRPCGQCGNNFDRLYQREDGYVCKECYSRLTGDDPLMTRSHKADEIDVNKHINAELKHKFEATCDVISAVIGGERVKRQNGTLELACKLTDYELLEAGSGLSQKLSELGAHESNLQRIKADYKALIEGCNTEISRLADLVRTKTEMRVTPITTTFDYAAGTVVVVRTDTFEQVSKRLMNDWERQAELPGVETETHQPGEPMLPDTSEFDGVEV